MQNGTAKVFIGLGGNFVRAVPDTERSYAAMRKLALTVDISTKLNRGHLVHWRDALILPVISRSETIRTSAASNSSRSKSDSFPRRVDSRKPHPLPEVEIVCRIALATLPNSKVPWESYIHDYNLIRDKIAEVYPDIFSDFSEKIKDPQGLHLDVPPRRLVWPTPNGKANFLLFPGLHGNALVSDPSMLRLATNTFGRPV